MVVITPTASYSDQSRLALLYAESSGRMMVSEGPMDNVSRRSILIGLPTLVTFAAVAEEKRLALKGYDPVSYFTEGRPEQGSAECLVGKAQ